MLYEEYSRKVKKYAAILNFIRRYRFLLIAVLAAAAAVTSVLIGIRGIVSDVSACPETVRYGEAIGYKADAIFTDVCYEFAQNGSDNWSLSVPVRVGEYRVRARAEGPFGIMRYGKEHSFAVLPKQTEVRVSGTEVDYGAHPQVTAELAYADTVTCTRFEYGDLSAKETSVIPVREAVIVRDAGGNDVTDCYDLVPVASQIGFLPRKITVTVQSKSAVYDGTPLMFDGYELSDETPLAEGDRLVATFEAQQTEAGEKENLPKLRVVREESGADVTGNYAIEIIPGKLTVEQRPLYVTTGSAEKLYDGQPLVCEEYSVQAPQEKSGLLEGHTLSLAQLCAATDAGDTQNLLRFSVFDGERDVTGNYSVFYDAGTLHIDARPLSVTTGGGTWMYDGQPHTSEEFSAEEASALQGLVKGHTASVAEPYSVKDAGSWENRSQIRILDEKLNDVSQNYDISYTYGRLEITPRPVLLRSADGSWIFDGKEHSEYGISVSSESVNALAEGDVAKAVSAAKIAETGTAENIVQVCIYDAQGREVTQNYLLTCAWGLLEILPRPVTVRAADAQKIYDGTPLSSDDFSAESEYGFAFAEGHTGVAVNEGSQTDADSSANTVASFRVLDGERDVTYNYALTFESGTLTVLKRPITVKSESAEKVYDATALVCGEYELSCDYGPALVEGHEIYVSIVGSIVDAGSAVNYVGLVTIMDGERDVTFNYAVSKRSGMLRVLPRPVTVENADGRWVYDGQQHTENAFSVSAEGPYGFVEGQKAVTEPLTFAEDAGEEKNVLAYSVFSAEGADVSANYEITQIFGTLEVTPRPIVLEVVSVEKVYDGLPLVSKDVIVSSDYTPAIIDKHSLYFEPNASQTDVGKSECGLQFVLIYDSFGTDKTFDYEITIVKGGLSVTPRPVLFTAVSSQAYYDGYPLARQGAYAQPQEGKEGLLSWHTYDVRTQGSLTQVGSTANVILLQSVRIFENGRDVTFNYSVSCADGVLEVLPRPIAVESLSAEKMYDGTPLTRHESSFVPKEDLSEALVAGHTAAVVYSGSQTEIGQSENRIESVRILEQGRDVTHNYAIEKVFGILTVQIPDGQLEITSCNAKKMYDGTPLTCSGVSWNSTLPNGYVTEVHCIGSQTDVGSSYNFVEYTVTSPAGKDVTAVVRTSLTLGMLTVMPRPILIVTNSNSWAYDGRIHSDTGKTVSETSLFPLVKDETAVTTDATYIVDVGRKQNVLEIAILRADGTDVTENYTISYQYGILEITQSDFSGEGGNLDTSGQIGGGGSGGGSGGGGGGILSENVVVKVNSQSGGMVYLRLMSYGDYTGRTWETAESYSGWLDGSYSMNYLPGILLRNAGAQVSDIQIELLGGDYVLPYYLIDGEYGYAVQTSDVQYLGDTSEVLSLQYCSYDFVTQGMLTDNAGRYSAEEIAYRSYVRQNYTYVPGSTRAYLNSVIAEEGLDRNDPQIIAKVAKYIQNAAVYNLEYDPMLDRESDIVVSFLRNYREGICQHYASAAVMLYRTLGIPARYTIGYAGDTEAGAWTEIYGKNAHAWAEVYVDGFGWVQVEVTGAGPVFGDGSGIEGKPNTILIRPADEIKQYDGKPLYAYEVVGIEGENAYYFRELLQEGYTYQATFDGSQTEIGKSYSAIVSFELFAPDGSPETGIRFEYQAGTLTVVREMVITVRPYSLQKTYDGTPLEYAAGDYSVLGLPSGYMLDLSLEGVGLTEAGVLGEEVFRSIPYRISDNAGRDVTDDFVLQFETQSSLMVSRRKITVSTMSETKIYDGTPLFSDGYWISSGSLAEGETLKVVTGGEITDVGKTFNTVKEIGVYTSSGEDVTDNYEIVISEGVLEVIAD